MLTARQEEQFRKLFERALENYKADKREVLHQENASVLLDPIEPTDSKIILTVQIAIAPYRGEEEFIHGGG